MPRPPRQTRPSLADLGTLRDEMAAAARARAHAEREAQRLAAEEEARRHEFRHAVGEVQPLKRPPTATPGVPPPPPIPRQHLADEQAALAASLSDEFSPESLLDTDEALSWHRSPLSPDVIKRLRRGHWIIQRELDLHGARSDEARDLLAGFLRDAHRAGVRCVRIIHGKGLGSKDRQPVLKGKVRRWLVQREEVIAFCAARAADGGTGALIVLLRALR